MDISSYTKYTRYSVFALLILGVISLGFTTYIFWKNYEIVGTDQMNNYWEMLSAIGIIIGVAAIATEYIENTNQREYDRQQTFIEQTETNWIELEKYFVQNYPYLARLYQQMYPENYTLKGLPPNLSKDDMRKVIAVEQHTCSILFQIIENVYIFLSSQLGSNEYCGWLFVWKSWFKSSIIMEQWRLTKNYYSQQTKNFIDNCIIKDCLSLKNFCNKEEQTPFNLTWFIDNPIHP